MKTFHLYASQNEYPNFYKAGSKGSKMKVFQYRHLPNLFS